SHCGEQIRRKRGRCSPKCFFIFNWNTNCTPACTKNNNPQPMKKILITGGAGFIGSHLCDELLKNHYAIRILDNLSDQVHGGNGERPEYLNGRIELVKGDIRDVDLVEDMVKEAEAVFHFAALVGVGQSMYKLREYTDVNNLGTATLLEAII